MHASKKRRESFAPQFAKAAVGCFGVKTKHHNNDENINNRTSLVDVGTNVNNNSNRVDRDGDLEMGLGLETGGIHHHHHEQLKRRIRQPRRKARQTSANDAVTQQREQELLLQHHSVSQPLSLSSLPNVDGDTGGGNNNNNNNPRQQPASARPASSSVSIWKKLPSKTRQQRQSRLRSPHASTLSAASPSQPLQSQVDNTQAANVHAIEATTANENNKNNAVVAAAAGNTVAVAENKRALPNVTTV